MFRNCMARTFATVFTSLSSASQSVARASPVVAAASVRSSLAQAPLQRGLQFARQLTGVSLHSATPSMASIRPGTARALQIR